MLITRRIFDYTRRKGSGIPVKTFAKYLKISDSLILGVPEEDEALMMKLTQELFGSSDPDVQRSFEFTDFLDVVKEVAVPCLIIAGDQDPVATPEDAQRLAEAAPNGKALIIPGANHLQSACVNPEKYQQALKEFFDSLPNS